MTKDRAIGRHRADRPRGRRRAAVVAGGATAAVLLGSASAVAFWSASGSGSGAAESAQMQPPVVAAGTVTGPALYPGSSGATLAIKASNPNPFPVTVTVAQAVGAVTGCDTPAVTFSGGSFTLPADATDVQRTVASSVSMGANASNDCQGKTLSVPLTTSSVSN